MNNYKPVFITLHGVSDYGFDEPQPIYVNPFYIQYMKQLNKSKTVIILNGVSTDRNFLIGSYNVKETPEEILLLIDTAFEQITSLN